MDPSESTIRLAVVTGGHHFDVPAFHHLFRGLAGVDAYIQTMDDFASSPQATRDAYAAVLFYHMLQDSPNDAGVPGYASKPIAAVARLKETGQGIVALHHTLLAYPQWPLWRELTGIDPAWQSYHHDQRLKVQVAQRDHPITAGLNDFELVDETYQMNEPDAGSQILLTTAHPTSLKAQAWVRSFGLARVFSLVLGHDNQAWGNAGFEEVLARGIRWAAN
jgi:uncharacterized protein